MAVISHVELSSSAGSWLIATSIKQAPSTVRTGVVVTSINGILGAGDFTEEPVARSYSDGSVYNPNATREGKSMSIPITFYSDSPSSLASAWSSFENFIFNSSTVTLQTYGGYNKVYNCQAQLTAPSEAGLDRIDCTLFLDAREAI